MIYIPSYRYPEIELAPSQYAVEGRFRIVVQKEQIKEPRLDTGWFGNMILDSGLDYIGSGSTVPNTLPNLLTTIAVGNGNIPAVPSQTELQALTYSSTTDVAGGASTFVLSEAPYYVERTIAKRFATGTATGVISEVGVGWGATNLFARQLVKDPEGVQTIVQVLSDEYIDVYYSLRLYPYLTDHVYSMTISGINHTVTARTARAGTLGSGGTIGWTVGYCAGAIQYDSGYGSAYSGDATLRVVTSVPLASTEQKINTSNGWTVSYPTAYVAGSFYKDTLYDASVSAGNLSGGIGGLLTFNGIGVVQEVFSPVIAKDYYKVLKLTKRTQWSRY